MQFCRRSCTSEWRVVASSSGIAVKVFGKGRKQEEAAT